MKMNPLKENISSKEQLIQLIERFKDLKALIIGDVMMDSYLWGKVDRISPEAPVPVVALRTRENRLGGAANVALNIQSLGATPVLCSVIGNDIKGEQLLQLLEQQNMVSDGIFRSDKRVTTVKFRIMGNNAQLLRVDEESEHNLHPEEFSQLFQRIEAQIAERKVDVVIFEDYDKGVISPELIEKVVALAKKHRIPVVVDPKKKNFWSYQHVTLFKPNLKELREGLKLEEELSTIEKIDEAAGLLQQKLGAEMILTTLSDKGIYYRRQSEGEGVLRGHYPAQLRKISDVSGAGDTVVSVAALSLAAGMPLHIIAWLANLAGGIVCEHAGVVPIDKQQLLSEASARIVQ